MPDGIVSATEATQKFPRLLQSVENGDRITITKDGRPVAILMPAGAEQPLPSAAALERFDALTARGMSIGYAGNLDREALRDR